MRTIYSTLSGCAQSWLSSQNEGAQQLSANIDYMKYAMGSAFAPVIEFVTNLIYQLMKAVQSLAYAFSGVNIFAKATASSMKSASGSASKASKSLAGIHGEINNISENSNSGAGSSTPNIDLSQMDNTPSSIIEAIKNGDWTKVGATIGEKLNNAMSSIPWDKIQNAARNIGTGIAQTLNGFIGTTDWNQVGNTFAQGLNTVFYLGYSFVTTFDWEQLGTSISDSINGFFNNIDWSTAAQGLSEGIIGALSTISTALETIDWQGLATDLEEYITNIDWSGVVSGLFRSLGAALGGLTAFLGKLICDAFIGIGTYFNEKVEECGGDIVAGILLGIIEAINGIAEWINENIFEPFIDGFKNAFGIHSPSTVMKEQGNFIMQGLLDGIKSLVNKVIEVWNSIKEKIGNVVTKIKDKVTTAFTNIKNAISKTMTSVKTTISNVWNGIWNVIKGVVNKILGGIESFVNGTIKGINKLLSGISKVASAVGSLIGLNPISLQLSTISLPRLAKGNVAYSETVAVFGEYSGARNNPEITTPQNIMRETFSDVLAEHEYNRPQDVGTFKQLVVKFGSMSVAVEIEKLMQQARRQNGTAYLTI